jgi:hypothetical protein
MKSRTQIPRHHARTCQRCVSSYPVLISWYRRPYVTDMHSIIPLPDANAPVGTPAHPASYPEHPPGAEVMAIYVSTTSFYRAVVVAGPKEPWIGGRVCSLLVDTMGGINAFG